MESERAAWRAATTALSARIERAFGDLRAWLAARADALDYRPEPGTWTAREVLEHVALADRFLLVLARKLHAKSARRAARGDSWPVHPPRFDHLTALASREYPWPHPEHMTPGGKATPAELCTALASDCEAARALVASLAEGQGTLHTIRMSAVREDDRLDLYQYIHVIALHAERHLAQLERNRRAFECTER